MKTAPIPTRLQALAARLDPDDVDLIRAHPHLYLAALDGYDPTPELDKPLPRDIEARRYARAVNAVLRPLLTAQQASATNPVDQAVAASALVLIAPTALNDFGGYDSVPLSMRVRSDVAIAGIVARLAPGADDDARINEEASELVSRLITEHQAAIESAESADTE